MLRDRAIKRGWGLLDERKIVDELDMDKAGLRNKGREGLRQRYYEDLYCYLQ